MTALQLLTDLRARGVVLSVKGDKLAYDAPSGALTPATLATLRANKIALLAALAPKPKGCAWREDKHGRLWFSDGTVYAPLEDGSGWVLVKHPTKRLVAPGTVEVAR